MAISIVAEQVIETVDRALQQRLTGAVVLIALVVIFVPMFFAGAGYEQRLRWTRPSLPQFESGQGIPPPVPTTALPAQISTSPPAQTSTSPSAPVPIPVPPPPKTIKPQDLEPATSALPVAPAPPVAAEVPAAGLAWVLQVGSFSERKNADERRDHLRQQGYSAFVETVEAGTGEVYKVQVGPIRTREAADRIKQELTQNGAFPDSFIKPYRL